MTRIGPQHVLQRQGDVFVLMDERTGAEVVMQAQDVARLAAAIPYLLTGSVAVAEVAAERIRQQRTRSRAMDLSRGPQHAADMLHVVALYAALAARQVEAFTDVERTRELAESILAGAVPAPEGWPDGWVWDPSADPGRNVVIAAALACAAEDVLESIRDIVGGGRGRQG